MSDKKTILSRRKFLVTVGAGGAAGAAALVVRDADTPAAQADNDKRSGAGYQVTQHVHNYYRTTKV